MGTQTIEPENSFGKATLEYTNHGVAIVRLGAPAEHVVTLDHKRMHSLQIIVEELKAKSPRGLVIIGPNENMFTAGADVNAIQEVDQAEVGEKLARQGQALFDGIDALPCITVAAISGACVGGGCEMALACDYRVISDSKGSLIGLPETKLGILPGFGGTQRLPRLIGLPAALDIILGGKTLRPKKALNVGLVDKIAKFEQLETTAREIAAGSLRLKKSQPGFVARVMSFSSFGQNIVRSKTEKLLHKKTKGFYPAPPAALEACIYGLKNGMPAGLKFEAKELGRLITTTECKALVNLFFLSEESKKLGKNARKEAKSTYGTVIGAGTMGAGIAGLLSKNECNVILKDRSDKDLKRGIEYIKKDLSGLRYLSEADKSFILNRIEITSSDSPNLSSVNFAIEAIFEEIEIKKKVLSEVAQQVSKDAIIATNTSSLSVSEIASAIPHPERVIGMHFFNPVSKMPLVEIVRGKQTSDKTIVLTAALTAMLGKFPIVVNDVPGFLVNRVLSPYLNEAGFLLADGYDIKSIDKAALGFGMPMGPLRLLDEIGLDVAAHVADSMLAGYGERMKSAGLLSQMVAQGRKGKKNGLGFYDFGQDKPAPTPKIHSMLGIDKGAQQENTQAIVDRLIMSLVNEAVRCLDEGVSGEPGKEAANQIDLGSVMGFGFPPFRGGVLYYAESLGAQAVLETLHRLYDAHGERYKPWEGIVRRAERGVGFHATL